MYLRSLKIINHPVLKDLELNFVNPKTNEPYRIIAFVGENGCGKTSLLNEIYENKYSKREYEYARTLGFDNYFPLYLRQNSLAKNAMRETNKLIDGSDPFPNKHDFARLGLSDVSSPLVDIKKGVELLMGLDDLDIVKIYKDDSFDQISCAQVVTEKIDGRSHGIDISEYSSGQQEILLKLKDLKEYNSSIDCVLLDEPETSLHPRWQKEIIKIIEDLLKDSKGSTPQIFLATHSEKVLESLISRNDVLIIRLSKDGSGIKSESINEMNLCLPIPTFAELDYLIFHIASFEYHDQLFNRFEYLIKKNSTLAVDERIEEYLKHNYKDDSSKYLKSRIFVVHHKEFVTNTICTYIRDYFHHPNNVMEPNKEELELSISLLRDILKSISKDTKN